MASNYRIRLKKKIVVKLALLTLLFFIVLFLTIYQFVNSELFNKTEDIRFTEYKLLSPKYVRKQGKHGTYKEIGRFVMPSGKMIEREISSKHSINGEYCIAKVINNGKFRTYTIVSKEKCTN